MTDDREAGTTGGDGVGGSGASGPAAYRVPSLRAPLESAQRSSSSPKMGPVLAMAGGLLVLGVLGVVMPLHRGPGLSIGVIVGVGLGLLGVAVGLLAWRRRF